MEFQTAYDSGKPIGTWVILDDKEARYLTSVVPQHVIVQALAGIGPKWAPLAARAFRLQAKYIRAYWDKFPRQGVELLFIWKVRVFGDIKRPGMGFSMGGRFRHPFVSKPTPG